MHTTLRRMTAIAALATLAGCGNYRLVRLDPSQLPSYEPREVPFPASCEPLLQRAGASGVAQLTEREAREVSYCQGQQMIRAQEEEAAARKLEAHAQAANFVLRLATVVIGATVAVLAWVF